METHGKIMEFDSRKVLGTLYYTIVSIHILCVDCTYRYTPSSIINHLIPIWKQPPDGYFQMAVSQEKKIHLQDIDFFRTLPDSAFKFQIGQDSGFKICYASGIQMSNHFSEIHFSKW